MKYEDIKKTELMWRINQKLIPTTQLDFSEESLELFNSIVNRCNAKKFNRIERTAIGSYAYSKTICPAYDVRATKSLIELTYCAIDGMFRLQIRTVNKDTNDNELTGWKSFLTFKKLCAKYDIDLDSYAIDNGAEVKKDIEPYIIDFGANTKKHEIYFDAHHLDFHSSFPSGLIITHPEFTPVITELYNGRKQNPEYKYILNSTIGYMQSQDCCKAKWAHLSRDAINNNNKRIRDLAQRLIETGHEILAYNTDGIWYTGDVYHDENEGKKLTQWENDHTYVAIRFKSKGSYEYMDEDGNYTPVVRGRTLLDDVKPREDWVWGDIYQENTKVKKIVINEDNTLSVVYREV